MIALKVFVANGVLLGYEVVVKDSDNNDQIVSVRSFGEPQYLHTNTNTSTNTNTDTNTNTLLF